MSSDFWVGIAFCAFGVLCFFVALLCGRGNLSYNFLVGIKTSATLDSPGAWKAGHIRATPSLIGLALVFSFAGVYSIIPGSSVEDWFVAVFAVAVILCSVWSVFSAHRGAKEFIERESAVASNEDL